jgi:hypothetical protein
MYRRTKAEPKFRRYVPPTVAGAMHRGYACAPSLLRFTPAFG